MPGKTLLQTKCYHSRNTEGNNVPLMGFHFSCQWLQLVSPICTTSCYSSFVGRKTWKLFGSLAVSHWLCCSFIFIVSTLQSCPTVSLPYLYYFLQLHRQSKFRIFNDDWFSLVLTVLILPFRSSLCLWYNCLSSAPSDQGYSESKCGQEDILMFWTAGSNPTPQTVFRMPSSLIPSLNFWDQF